MPAVGKFARLTVTGVLPCCLLITITVSASSEVRVAANAERLSGLAVVAEGLARAAQTGARIAEPEMHRVKGELTLLDPPDEAEAERCFRIAVDIARAQGARWWELRAATSRARLLRRQGRTAEARNQLGEIYNWFTEGFEFADLKDAKALLDELAQ